MKTHCKHGHELAVVGRTKRGRCKECVREYDRRRRETNPERAREAVRERVRRWREADPDRAREANRRWYVENADNQRRDREQRPEVYRARDAVRRALASGKLEREPCLFCDAAEVEAHHHDYSQPLAVTWLCPKHHGLVHRAAPVE